MEFRARARMDERIEEHRGEIVSTAEARLAKTKHAYLGSLGELEQAIGELSAALAIKRWADDPSASYRLRGLRPVGRLVGEPTVDVVLDALRALIGPPRSAVMPSPFGAAPVDPEVEPASAHSYEAELAAGSPPRPENKRAGSVSDGARPAEGGDARPRHSLHPKSASGALVRAGPALDGARPDRLDAAVRLRRPR
jgi:hypothetical protein